MIYSIYVEVRIWCHFQTRRKLHAYCFQRNLHMATGIYIYIYLWNKKKKWCHKIIKYHNALLQSDNDCIKCSLMPNGNNSLFENMFLGPQKCCFNDRYVCLSLQLGFNIRGGKEHNCGIFVSKVTKQIAIIIMSW